MSLDHDIDEHVIHQARLVFQQAQLVMTKNPVEARKHLQEARRLDPKNIEFMLALGRLEVRLGSYVDAIASLTRAIALGGPNAEAQSYMARAHIRLKHYEEAGQHSREALALDPENILAQECLIECLIAWRQFEKALEEITKLSRRDVLSVAGIARMSKHNAICWFMLGDYVQVWQITSMMIAAEKSDPIIVNLYNQSEARAKAEILEHTKDLSWRDKLFSRMFNGVFVSLFMKTHSGRIKSLQKKNTDALRELNLHQAKTSSLERRAGEAERAAKTDELTGLPNLKCLNDDYLPHLSASVGPVAVVAVDLDRFKLINDTHGHSGGDIVLKKMAEVASKWFRHAKNNFFRVGGEEFVGLVFSDEEQAMALAESFRLDLAHSGTAELAKGSGLPLEGVVLENLRKKGPSASRPMGWGLKAWDGETQELKDRLLTASIGLALFPEDGRDFEDLRKKADAACYAAKAGGRNRLVRWRAGMLAGTPTGTSTADRDVTEQRVEVSAPPTKLRRAIPRKKAAGEEHIETLREILDGQAKPQDPATTT